MFTESLAIITSVVATLAGALVSLLAAQSKTVSLTATLLDKMFSSSRSTADEAKASPSDPRPQPDPSEAGLKQRLREVRALLRKQQFLATAYRIANASLTIGQFIVGGLLASSFLQEQLSKQMVGGLGLIVLASSLLRQHFRPDVELAGCIQRAAKLRQLVRQAEDSLFSIAEGEENAPTHTKIRKMLSEGLSTIEESELHDLPSIAKATPRTRQRKQSERRDQTGNGTTGSEIT